MSITVTSIRTVPALGSRDPHFTCTADQVLTCVLLRPDHKATPKWAWPGSRGRISKFWDPLITFEPMEISASNSAQI